MSEDETTRAMGTGAEGETEEYPTLASGLTASADLLASPHYDDEGDDEWPVRGPAKGLRLSIPGAALVTILLVAGGFWGGAALEKHHSGGSSASAASSLAARFRGLGGGTTGTTGTSTTGTTGRSGAAGGFGGFGGFGGAGGASTAAATGTLSVVDGKTLYILTTTGSLVKVTLGTSTTITRSATTQAVDLRPGDTVVVQGTTAKNGDVAATSVSATAPASGAASG
jgi:hypothetical protein